jgi:hypothetical protein
MRKTTLYLPDDLKRELEQTAAATGRSEADIVREGLRLALARRSPPPPTIPIYVSKNGDIAERVDEALAEGFGRT